MTDAASRIIVCPQCATSNRVPEARLKSGGTCGRCHAALFAAEPLVLTTANFDAHAAKSDLEVVQHSRRDGRELLASLRDLDRTRAAVEQLDA